MNQIRRKRIANYIQEKGVVTTKELNDLVSEVSSMTIHRDLENLEERGIIVRTRGGAMSASLSLSVETKLESRLKLNIKAKKQIAKKALPLIQKGSVVYFDAGTSNQTLVQSMPNMELNAFTNGLSVALELSKLSKPVINICGGGLNRNNQALSGYNTLTMLEHFNITTAFIGVSGYTKEAGFTCGEESEMLVKRLVMKKAKTSVILMDSSKIGKLLPYTFAHIEDADYIICDNRVPESFVKLVNEQGKFLF